MSKSKSSVPLLDVLYTLFPHEPTDGQKEALYCFSRLLEKDSEFSVMLLKGYAGTGKTTLVKAVADAAVVLQKPVILLSPTGRGAKVMTDISKHEAFTIHKHIYHFEMKPNGSASFKLAFNKFTNALFIIDEASMIQGNNADREDNGFIMPDSGLLRDLFDYINGNKDNKIIIIGDPAQLPPVNHTISPALNEHYLDAEFNTNTLSVTLRDIVRQAADSGILTNATKIRYYIENNHLVWPDIDTEGFEDIQEPESWQIQELLTDTFSRNNNDSVIITVSNKVANKYNEFLRKTVFQCENELDAGDQVMAVKNNYFWLDSSGNDFIANGEMMHIMSVRNTEIKYGFRFADVSVKLLYQKNEPVVDVKVLTDVLHLPSPALPHDMFLELWNSILKAEGGKVSKKRSLEILATNPYINALQIKFAWALTCHKAQGGQWKKVFIDTEFLKKRAVDISGLRWLYTAVTRAQAELILLR